MQPTTTPTRPELDRSHLPDFLAAFGAMHDAMRRDAARLVERTEPDARPDIDTGDLAEWWRRFERTILNHHGREDRIIFPALAAQVPQIVAELDALEADHERLDAAMHAVAAAITADDRCGLAHAARSFAEILDDHLSREEAIVFPAIVTHLGEERFAEIEATIDGESVLREAIFEAPWVLDGATPEFRASVMRRVPALLRPLLRLVFEPRYRRIAAVVRGGAR